MRKPKRIAEKINLGGCDGIGIHTTLKMSLLWVRTPPPVPLSSISLKYDAAGPVQLAGAGFR